MSRLTVGSLEGLSENSNVISVPTGHTLNVADAGALQIGGSGIVSAGLKKITSATFTAVSSVSTPANTFTTDYTMYRVVFLAQASSANSEILSFQTNIAGSAHTGNVYFGFRYQVRLGTAVSNTPTTSHYITNIASSAGDPLNSGFSIDVVDPANSSADTTWHGTYFGINTNNQFDTGPTGCGINGGQADDGFTVTVGNGTITGQYMVYAYV